ncbi:DUF3616 domain-containing protein [Leptolyngbya sp. AN02str]|uniref:DUF3616 domain-containing protein n=1 Tax=Leptolyngbya sp. AN02str TaxID=3423363 RepID=UPI003D3205A5
MGTDAMGADAFLLGRVLVQFDDPDLDLKGNISGVAIAPDGSLWLGSDELASVERLQAIAPYTFGKHHSCNLHNFLPLPVEDQEIDIEGMEYRDGYLWLTGSHSTKRKKPKGKKPEKDLKRLKQIKTEPNRYTVARIPLVDGELHMTAPNPDHSNKTLSAGWLPFSDDGSNVLTEALAEDEHLGTFVANDLPSKENGFDVEGLAVQGDRLFLGLRGPVLRGWAIILELCIHNGKSGEIKLKTFKDTGKPYRKLFVDLDGLGVRDLCMHGDDLLILAGATMDLIGATRVFRLRDVQDQPSDTLISQEDKELTAIIDLPYNPRCDKAEGMTLFPYLGFEGLLIAHDDPAPNRVPNQRSLLLDVFRL